MTSAAPLRRASDRPSEPLLPAKLFLPRRKHGLVGRSRLVKLLDRADTVPLVLVDAPPGWGKTTLLVQWSAERPNAVGWVSLDGDDNDPTRFWTYFLTAVAEVHPKLPLDELAASVRLHGVVILRDVLPALVDSLATSDRDIFVVLDDYHVITNSVVHESVAGLVATLPERVHLVLASRSDPPLGLAQLRARGELLEVRAEQLRFTDDETTALINAALDRPLEQRYVSRLRERTEGWAAGLQLAALTLRDRSDVETFLDEFTGDDRHVVDYLVAEVLDALPDDLRAFLVRTSVLHQLSGPLCDAVLDKGGSSAVLSEIDRRGLFLVPLDRNRRWYRYHHLFGELLRHELSATEPQLLRVLHDRAARWWEKEGDAAAAVQHADAAGDADATVRLVRDHWRTLFNQGLLTTVQRWIELLPKSTVVGDELLSEAAVWTALDRGDLDTAEDWLTHMAHLGHGARLPLLRALLAFKRGDLDRSRELLGSEVCANPDDFAQVVRQCLDGVTAYWAGDAELAATALAAATTAAELSGNLLAETYARGYRALALLRLGEVDRAADEVRTARDVSPDPAVRGHFVAMAAALAGAHLAELRDEPDEALQLSRTAVELARRGAGLVECVAAFSAAAHHERVTGNRGTADVLAAEASATLVRCPAPGPLLGRPATAGMPRPRPADVVEELTDRELAILRMLPGTASNRELASALFVSQNTLKTHLRAIYRKIGVATRSEAVDRAQELGLLARQAR